MPRTIRLSILSLALTALLAGCASPPQSLSELPRTPQASAEKILADADKYSGAEANLMRLYAAQAASDADQPQQVLSILERIPQSELPLDQQVRFSTLQARSALALDRPAMALRALRHPSMSQLDSVPLTDQVAIQRLRALALGATGEPLKAARERVFLHGVLSGPERNANRLAIWENLQQVPVDELSQAAQNADSELQGWIELALIERELRNLDLQVQAVKAWQEQNSSHPAADPLPDSIRQLLELYASRPQHIALLLPFEGPLATAAEALRDGFLAAQYQAQSRGMEQPRVSLYDSTAYADLDQFYAQANVDGVQWVIGPLDRDRVGRLASKASLPIPTLALNYSEAEGPYPEGLYQFGLAPEDEARSAAMQAWQQGHRQMAALHTSTDWGQRAYQSFRRTWEEMGGVLIGRVVIDQPAEISSQIADLLQIRQSEQRNQRVARALDGNVAVQPTPRQDLDALFIAVNPQQARQIKPTLAFQYAADLPVYATSHVYQVGPDGQQNADMDGIMVAEIPWLLTRDDKLYGEVISNWPQAQGPLGRLYAMGIDAQRVFSRLPQMQQRASTRVSGATGGLSLSPDGRIRRDLSWGVMERGQLSPLPNSRLQ
ncbi:MAG: penicillin-binding protein activator [Pseudomonas sp.]|nr:penicillin-binding protein activator [Pseudomonas sp.]